MPKVVKTANGQERVVLTEKEFEEFCDRFGEMEVSRDRRGNPVCHDCGMKLWETEILHLRFTDPDAGNLSPSASKTAVMYGVNFCPVCEGYPEFLGLPIVEFGSYYDRPH